MFARQFTLILFSCFFGKHLQQDDFDPSLSFLQMVSDSQNRNSTIPDLNIDQFIPATQEQPQSTVIALTDVISGVQQAEVETAAPKEEKGVELPQSLSVNTTDQDVGTTNPSGIIIVTGSQLRPSPPELLEGNPQPSQIQQSSSLAMLLTQPINASQTGGVVSNSAFIVQGSPASTERINPIYGNVRFPVLQKSGRKSSNFVYQQGTQTDLVSDLLDPMLEVGCNPLLFGNACLDQLLQSTSFFFSSLGVTGLTDEICQFSPLTVVAPTDNSFARLAMELGIIVEDFLATTANQRILTQILRLHLFAENEITPRRMVERTQNLSEQLLSWLGQFVYVKADINTNTVSFRPPIGLAPSAIVSFQQSGQNIYLKEGCKLDYYYVVENVLIPDFSLLGGP
eukprot:TRINITY_DN52471_c0_g1_i10.p1 TRINITY_DN52471_c0_g1~~TRINITY_DN52471_c0_g1_i10.p1  ORF type:complete len:397 (-),score=14.76 TRINITY_DN52471_c0_g1_i10:1253-2443(-)